MEIIEVEGLDKSGKYSATEMLQNFLESQGYKVVKSEFHRYDTPTGELIMKWLTGKWDVDQKTIELVMSADKQAQQKWFDELEQQGIDFLILDRYMTSQQVYSQANGISPGWTEELQSYMRLARYMILLDIPAEVSMARKGKHNNGENDRYESDLEMLKNVRELYLEKAECFNGEWSKSFVVDGTQSLEKVHEDIVKSVKNFIIK